MEQISKSPYICSGCGKAVIVTEEEIIRICEHNDAPVIANLSATCYSLSTLEQMALEREIETF
jgi:hypothetical protein